MKKQSLIKQFLILFMLLVLAGCSKVSQDTRLLGTWAASPFAFQSAHLANTLVFTSETELKQLDGLFGSIKETKYQTLLPGLMVINPKTENLLAKYSIEGDTLLIQFEDEENSYKRIKNDFGSLDALVQDLLGGTLSEENPVVTDPNATIGSDNPPGVQNEANATPTAERVTPTAQTSPTPQPYYPLSDCSVSQVRLGESVYVNFATGRLGMRKEPSARIGDLLIRKLDEGEVLHIIDGPICDMDWVFWKVRTVYSEIGWIPEGDGSEFWVLPLNTEMVCEGAKPTRLWVGARAYVEPEPEDYNRIYPEPKIESDRLIYRMKPGSYMQVLAGPLCGPNREGVWWYVRSEDSGKEGWTRESSYQKDYYFIAPVIPRP